MNADLIAIGLGLFSAVTLAAVNAVVKAGRDILMARVVLAVTSTLILLPFIFVVPLPTGPLWLALLFSVLAHGLYQFGLINALSRGDLSLVFPVMRGGAPILVAIAALLFLGERLEPIEWAGLMIATAGTLGFVFRPGFTDATRKVGQAALGFACLTACGIAAYSVLDARGVRLADQAVTYVVWLFVLDGIQLGLAGWAIRGRRLIADGLKIWRYGVVAAIGSVLSFGAILFAMDLTEVARVSALRESAVIFGALFGWLFLKEGFGPRRLFFALIVAAGLALMNL
ncbi:EamA family transporter [Algimonas porphyrae]|uniref:Membrane protein n=1 Tax=Algimonas porphyrae TaxID=1128113 RepID=A0ABQ5V5Z5_9PROT|nr:DMT family transporter [Algimonas porphyrae]GLQ21996.1 membrane protein [Algimonas porphyrae]